MFFSQFPSVAYDFNRTGTVQQMVNIFRSVRPETVESLNNLTLYKDYKLKDGMRPDVLSQILYGTPDYYWTFFIINDHLHDGLQTWPMSEEVLRRYMETNYSGKALCFKPEVVRDADGIPQGTKNSVSGILELGQLIYGVTSGAVGRIVRKDADLQEIIVKDIAEGQPNIATATGAIDTTVQGGTFRAGEFLKLADGTNALQIDSTTLFSLQINKCYDYAQAPAYYYRKGDPDKRPITNPDGIKELTAIYSEIQWNTRLQSQIPGFSQSSLGDNGTQYSINSNAVFNKPFIYSGGYDDGYGESLAAGLTVPDTVEGENDILYITNEQRVRDLNEERCYLKIIDPAYILEFIEEFENVLNA